MKNFVFALVLGIGLSLTACSSNASKVEEPTISGSTGTTPAAAEPVASTANLGSASSGQGR